MEYGKDWARKLLAGYKDAPTIRSPCIEFLRKYCDCNEIEGIDLTHLQNWELAKKAKKFHKRARITFLQPEELEAKVVKRQVQGTLFNIQGHQG